MEATAAQNKLGYLIDDLYLLHDPGRQHPESPARLRAIQQSLASHATLDRWARIAPRPAVREELELVHRPALVDHVEKAARSAPTYLDSDTVVSAESYSTAVAASGGVLECVEAVLSKRLTRSS